MPKCEFGEVLLADTRGWEPDAVTSMIEGFKEEMTKTQCNPNVLTDLMIVVVAGQPQSLSEFQQSQQALDRLREAYAQFRKLPHLNPTILPVITFGDQIPQDQVSADVEHVRTRLKDLCPCNHSESSKDGKSDVPKPPAILDPMVVSCSEDIQKIKGIMELRSKIQDQIKSKYESAEFRDQWIVMQNVDLVEQTRKFLKEFPDAETEMTLFRAVLNSICAAYGQTLSNMHIVKKPRWELLGGVEMKLRGEQAPKGWFASILYGAGSSLQRWSSRL